MYSGMLIICDNSPLDDKLMYLHERRVEVIVVLQ